MPDEKKILVVEDDNFLSSLIKARFERENFVVIQAFDGQEAIEILKKERPTAIILDLIMPRASGFEVLEHIALDTQLNDIPVVILSNLAQESDIQKAKQLGAREFFIKIRISVNDLITKVKELIGV